MLRAVLGQPPARGTLGLVVYSPVSNFPIPSPRLSTLLLLSPSPSSTPTSWSPDVPTYDYTTQKSLLRDPARCGRRPSPVDYSSQKSSGEVLPSLLSRTTIPRTFSCTVVPFLLDLFLSCWASAGQQALSDDVIRRDWAQGFLSGLSFFPLSYSLYRPSRLA